MCNYCGCLSFPIIATLTEEHFGIEETAGLLRRAIGADDHATARRLLTVLTDQLGPHMDREECGLFAELTSEATLHGAVEQLCAEHEDLHAALQPPAGDEPDWARVLTALDRLREHIDKEEYGIFPAAVILLPMPAWDRISTTE